MPHGDPHCHSIIIAVMQPDPDGVSAERRLRQQALGCQQQPHDGYGRREGQVPTSTAARLSHRLGLGRSHMLSPAHSNLGQRIAKMLMGPTKGMSIHTVPFTCPLEQERKRGRAAQQPPGSLAQHEAQAGRGPAAPSSTLHWDHISSGEPRRDSSASAQQEMTTTTPPWASQVALPTRTRLPQPAAPHRGD